MGNTKLKQFQFFYGQYFGSVHIHFQGRPAAVFTLCMVYDFACCFIVCCFLVNIFKKIFQEYHPVLSNSLDPDHALHFVRSYLGPDSLQRLSANDTGRQRVCILVTPKCKFWQTVKTQMKCCIMWHFIRVYTVC